MQRNKIKESNCHSAAPILGIATAAILMSIGSLDFQLPLSPGMVLAYLVLANIYFIVIVADLVPFFLCGVIIYEIFYR